MRRRNVTRRALARKSAATASAGQRRRVKRLKMAIMRAGMRKTDRDASRGGGRDLARDPVDRRGRTSLIRATIEGNLAEVVRQIDGGADVNASDSASWSALHFAAQQYRLEIAQALILAGARV